MDASHKEARGRLQAVTTKGFPRGIEMAHILRIRISIAGPRTVWVVVDSIHSFISFVFTALLSRKDAYTR
jgi:hypothetical protein